MLTTTAPRPCNIVFWLCIQQHPLENNLLEVTAWLSFTTKAWNNFSMVKYYYIPFPNIIIYTGDAQYEKFNVCVHARVCNCCVGA